MENVFAYLGLMHKKVQKTEFQSRPVTLKGLFWPTTLIFNHIYYQFGMHLLACLTG